MLAVGPIGQRGATRKGRSEKKSRNAYKKRGN